MRYRLLALDLDGTLLGQDSRVSRANLDAIASAQAAGTLVVPCTGRGWCESHHALRDMPGQRMGVFVTGAAVSDMKTGSTLDLAIIEPHVVARCVEALADEAAAVLVFRDRHLTGHDYLVTGKGQVDLNTQWWFGHIGAKVHEQRDVTPADLHHCLRVGMVAEERLLPGITARLTAAMGEHVYMHHFQAVPMPEQGRSLHVLEVFAHGVDKWRGVQWIAQQNGIAAEETACIGDQINDVSMITNAGCGIAMGNAIDAVKQAARHITGPHHEDGVAQAIHKMLRGEW